MSPETAAEIILSGIEMIHMMGKQQARYAYNPAPSLAGQFDILAALRAPSMAPINPCQHLRHNRDRW
ncbi:hypothetical protein GCM10007874_08340 [Labrys miyagiensis]|uniref:Transposase n=1 Tax=Labrys miyagiensis TaxID=346912 RepID=A0ABQ6CGI9_9HYPH|nr:hypothetical protein GCM10007874_08340 [Labrys miyagiensis]